MAEQVGDMGDLEPGDLIGFFSNYGTTYGRVISPEEYCEAMGGGLDLSPLRDAYNLFYRTSNGNVHCATVMQNKPNNPYKVTAEGIRADLLSELEKLQQKIDFFSEN